MDLSNMNLSNFSFSNLWPLLAAGVGGALIGFWSQLKGWLSSMLTHVLCHVEMHADLGLVIVQQLAKDSNISKFGRVGFLLKNVPVRNGDQRWIVTRWLPNSTTLLWYKAKGKHFRIPIWVSADGKVSFRFLRWTLDMAALVKEVIQAANSQVEGRFNVVQMVGSATPNLGMGGGGKEGKEGKGRPSGGNSMTRGSYFRFAYKGLELIGATEADLDPPLPTGRPETLYLAGPAFDILTETQVWKSRREWYRGHGLTWKRGYLLYGAPGTGKTALSRAIAISLDIPLYQIDLGSMTNRELQDNWNEAVGNAPCMILLEDIDGVYEGRTAIRESNINGTPPSFDTLINLIDGADQNNGVLTMITTNKIGSVDAALSGGMTQLLQEDVQPARPGRIDRVLSLPATLVDEGKRFIADRLFDGNNEMVELAVANTGHMTPAQFQEYCIQQLGMASGEHLTQIAVPGVQVVCAGARDGDDEEDED